MKYKRKNALVYSIKNNCKCKKCATRNINIGKEPWNKGKKGLQIPWNKGKTKETDKRVILYSEK